MIDKGFYRLCAWCLTSKAKTAELESQGWQVTHGICDTHYRELMKNSIFDEDKAAFPEQKEEQASFKEGPVDEG